MHVSFIHTSRPLINTKTAFLEHFLLLHPVWRSDTDIRNSLCWSKDCHDHFDIIIFLIMPLLSEIVLKSLFGTLLERFSRNFTCFNFFYFLANVHSNRHKVYVISLNYNI